jgi:hypothetical protein
VQFELVVAVHPLAIQVYPPAHSETTPAAVSDRLMIIMMVSYVA